MSSGLAYVGEAIPSGWTWDRRWAGVPARPQRPQPSRWPSLRFGASRGRRVHPAPPARCSRSPSGRSRQDTHRESRKSLEFWTYFFTPGWVTFA